MDIHCLLKTLQNVSADNKDEIAEPCPDMNIKVAAFTVSKKSINIYTVTTWPQMHRVSVEL